MSISIIRDDARKVNSGVKSRRLEAEQVEEMLERLDPNCDRDKWVRIGMVVKHELGEEGFDLFDGWSRPGKTYNQRDCESAWKSFDKPYGNQQPVTAGTLIHLAREADPDWQPSWHLSSKRIYADHNEYAAHKGVAWEVFADAGWEFDPYYGHPSLLIPTANGTRRRWLDQTTSVYINPRGFRLCWYRLDEALTLVREEAQPLVICNGEASTVIGQFCLLAAVAVASGSERTSLPDDLLDEL